MYEQSFSALPAIRSVWRAVVDEPARYVDPANEYWGLAFTRRPDETLRAELIGPSLQPRDVESLRGDAYWGVEFPAHVVVSGAPKVSIMGAALDLPVEGDHFVLLGRRYRVPGFEELEPFVAGLLDSGAITSHEDVRRALTGDVTGYSVRSWQRHIRWVTGLSRKQLQQLERARHAYFLLQNGCSPAATAVEAGYADQAHLTRSLRLLGSETPAQILARHRPS